MLQIEELAKSRKAYEIYNKRKLIQILFRDWLFVFCALCFALCFLRELVIENLYKQKLSCGFYHDSRQSICNKEDSHANI